MPGLMPIVGPTRSDAQAKHDALQALLDPVVGLASLYDRLGDLSGYPLDGPVPEPRDPAFKSRAEVMYRQAQRENYTIRQLYQAVALGRGHRVVVGTAADIVDQMESWQAAQAADGYNIIPSHLPSGIDDFVDLVVPELQRRGLFRREYQGKTLRENLGLAPEKRWTARLKRATPSHRRARFRMPLEPEPQLAAKALVRMMLTEVDNVGFDLALQGIRLGLVGCRRGRSCASRGRCCRRGRGLALGEEAQRGNIDAAFRPADQEMGRIARRSRRDQEQSERDEPDEGCRSESSGGALTFRDWRVCSHAGRLSCRLACPQARNAFGT